MSESANAPAWTEAQQQEFFKWIGQFLTCLGVTYVAVDRVGRPTGPERFLSVSGFLVSLDDTWYFVTAGHVFSEEIDNNVRAARMVVSRSVLIGNLGERATTRPPIIVDYDGMERLYIDNSDLGLDVGLIRLRPVYRQALEADKVRAIREDHWCRQAEVQFEAYCVVGFPASLSSGELPEGQHGEELLASIEPVLASVRRLEAVPDGVAPSTYPWFVGEVTSKALPLGLKGMSGGPIFGFKRMPDGNVYAWIVALQSRRPLPDSRPNLILGCPVPAFMEWAKRTIRESQ